MNRIIKQNLLAIGTIIFWSTSYPVTRVMGGMVSASSLAFFRCLSAAIFLFFVWLINKNRQVPKKEDVLYFIVTGATGFGIFLIFLNQGLKTLTSAESCVIIATTPIIVAVFSRILFKEKLSFLGWVSILGAFVGVAILMLWDNGLNIKMGMLWTLSAASLFAVYNFVNRTLSDKGYSSIDVVTFSMFFSVLMLCWAAPQAITEYSHVPMQSILFTAYLGVCPSAIAYALWGGALALAEKSSEVTNYMFVTPMLAAIEEIAFLHEIPTPGTYIGGSIIITMILLFNVKK